MCEASAMGNERERQARGSGQRMEQGRKKLTRGERVERNGADGRVLRQFQG